MVVDALSCRYALISTLSSTLLGFEHIKEIYVDDSYFSTVYNACEYYTFKKVYRHDGFLFKDGKLCMTNSSIMELIVCEAYSEAFMDTLG